MEPVVTEEFVYCLKGPLGFLCDTEWDGDSFTSSPLNAYLYETPREDGRGNVRYECKRIRIITITYKHHLDSLVIPVKTTKNEEPKTRYKCKCFRCGMSTRNYATPKNASDRYETIRKSDCITQLWEYAT